MADMNRRKGGATAARSHQAYMQNAAQNPQFQAYQQQQQQQMQAYQQQLQLQQQQQMQFKQHQQHQQHQQARMSNGVPAAVNRNARDRAGPVRGQQKAPVSAKMGIKSGMTVEDLKRLTQKRMQQGSAVAAATASPVTPRTPVVAALAQEPSSRPSTPTAMPMPPPALGMAPPAPAIPKTGMTVQELKQLTTLRLASQSVPMRQSEVTGLVSKAVLTNVAKSHYRDSLRGSLTPNSTPKRGPTVARAAPSALSLTPEVRGNRSRSRSSQLAKTAETPSEATQLRYSYSGGQTIDDYLSFDNNSTSSQETDSYARPSLDLDEDSRYPTDEPTHHSLQFPDDSFPPPPPMDENGGFMGNALPSWSPPPSKAKKYESGGSMSFYNQQTSYYNIASKEETAAVDQNAVIAPPPGLSRRPSMTVPWQVAEAVLNTPQTASSRKQLQSPANESENAATFAKPSAAASRAADVAAQLSAMSLQMGRQRSGTATSVGSSSSAAISTGSASGAASPPQALTAGARRGSFGNAAEFFKFRRRSKSRLELARDLSGNFVSDGEVVPGFPNYGTGVMPGIDESRADLPDVAALAHADTVSDASSSSSSASSDNGSSSQGYDDDEIVQITGGYDDPNEIESNFVSFYHATGASRSRSDHVSGLSSLSIPPPPPPPLTDDEDASSTASSSKGLPIMMSPNGFRLRKVAELARRGSLSSEDKTRAKDEIIQSSLGISASNAARILAPKSAGGAAAPPPPGFPVLSSTPPRTTPRASAKKTLAPGVGIVRSSASGPSSATGSRKALSGNDDANASGSAASLEERLASAAQRVADCVSKGDMVGFQKAMDELDWLRNEASSMMRG